MPASTVTFSRESTSRCHVDDRSVAFLWLLVCPKKVKVEFRSTWVTRFAEACCPTSRSKAGTVEIDVVAFARKLTTRSVGRMYVTWAT